MASVRDEAPAVVVLTGAGDIPESWMAVRDRLDPELHIAIPQRRGLIDRDGEIRTLGDFLAELDESVISWARPVVLVGHSFGGLLAQVYAERHPDRVAGLVLVDATPRAVAHHKGVAIGFAISARIMSAIRAVGAIRPLLALRALPLCPEQRRFEQFIGRERTKVWRAAVLAACRGGAIRELRATLPAAAEATELDASPSAAAGMPVALVTSRAYGDEWGRDA